MSIAMIEAFRECLPRIKASIDSDSASPLIRVATTPGRGFKYHGMHIWIIRSDDGRYVVDEYDGPREWLPFIEAEVEMLSL